MASTGDDSETESVLDDFSSISEPADDTSIRRQESSSINPDQRRESDIERNEDESDREGRFEGPSSNWRHFAEDEISLVASLDQQRANDLSVHLYNAHALKARIRDPATTNAPKSHKSKRSWIKANEDGSLPWHPAATWTAWPLKPESVPRKSEQFGVTTLGSDYDDETYQRIEPWTPGANLEEELVAVMQRKVKDELRQRKIATRGRASRGSSQMDDDEPTPVAAGSTKKSRTALTETHDHSAEAASLELLIDDEEATSILQPAARSIMSKLDELLMSLHSNRGGHARENSKSQSRNGRSKSRSRSKSAVPSKTKSLSRGRRQHSDDSEDESEDNESDQVASGDDEEQPKLKRRRHLNPRDWSEVLGTASLAGWDPAVVDRAAQRCASLFGEQINFETTSRAPSRDASLPHPGFACPVTTCSRHHEPFAQAWRWREHLKRSHKYSAQDIEDIEEIDKILRSDDGAEDSEGSQICVDETGGAANDFKNASMDDPGLYSKGLAQRLRTNDILQPITVKVQRGQDIKKRKARASRSRSKNEEA